jgi:hypothetical protein
LAEGFAQEDCGVEPHFASAGQAVEKTGNHKPWVCVGNPGYFQTLRFLRVRSFKVYIFFIYLFMYLFIYLFIMILKSRNNLVNDVQICTVGMVL